MDSYHHLPQCDYLSSPDSALFERSQPLFPVQHTPPTDTSLFVSPLVNFSGDNHACATTSSTPLAPSSVSAPIPGPSKPSALRKPPTSNFVTKLFNMIDDPKAARFIVWNETGMSFTVSNIGEFSRTILGSHFKHNNFSSFVRQLNMYGFRKVNRPSRGQRTSTRAQVWEFSHYSFVRGRPDLLDGIKRKAQEQDPDIKHRVELPGEVAAQIDAVRSDYQDLWERFCLERRNNERLSCIVHRLWDVVHQAFPASIPPSPNDIFGSVLTTNPNIYDNSPTSAPANNPPPLPVNFDPSLHSVLSPTPGPSSYPIHSSFPRQQNFQHVVHASSGQEATSASHLTNVNNSMGYRAFKRQRLSVDQPPAMSMLHGSGANVNINGYNHPQLHGHAGQYASMVHSHHAYHAHHSVVDGSTISSPNTATAPSSLQGIMVTGGARAGLGSRVVNSIGGVKRSRSRRARSDSAPFGPSSYSSNTVTLAGGDTSSPGGVAFDVGPSWLTGRPRSGSELVTLNQSGIGLGRSMGNMTVMANLDGPSLNTANQSLLPGPHDLDAMNNS